MVDFYALGCLLYEMLVGIPPYYSNDRQMMYYNKVYEEKLEFPDYLDNNCIDCLKGLLHKNPKQRLGCKNGFSEIKDHPYCKNIEWCKLLKKEVVPPYKPNPRISNFDSISMDSDILEDLIAKSKK